jgi:DNA-binding LacI/PurR family transcriptional regulator
MTATAPRPAATLRDVARLVGTTPMTVSNVVRGRSGQVGAALRARVREACDALGYRPHHSARQLRTRRRMMIGVVIVDPSRHYLSDPFTAALLAGLADVLGAAGYSIALHGADPAALDATQLFRRIESDGVCLISSGTRAARRAILDQVIALGQPVVLIQEEWPRGAGDGCSFMQDDHAGGVALARHLAERRLRHVAMLVPGIGWAAMERREAGVRAGLATLPQPPDLHLVRCGDEGFQATQEAFARHCAVHGVPDAVIGGNDRMAIAAMKWLHLRGIAVPGRVRVTGFNGFDSWRHAEPELTTVLSPAFRLGEESGQAMVARLAGGRFARARTVLPVAFAPNRSSTQDGGHRTAAKARPPDHPIAA